MSSEAAHSYSQESFKTIKFRSAPRVLDGKGSAVSEFGSLVAFVLPASLGAAWSPLILASATEVMSSKDRPRRKALAFFVGGVVALLIWAVLIVSALWSWFVSTARDVERDLPTLEVVLGVILLLAGLVILLQWRRVVGSVREARERKKNRDDGDQRGPWGWVVFGVVMQGRDVSSMVLYVAIVGRIAAADLPLVVKFGVLACSIGIITAAFWVPLVAHVSVPGTVPHWARPLGAWISAHAQPLTVAITWGMAALLLWHALFLGG